eukprot:GILI01026111.1.p2 GENE.GILI01026111.1~~GILI01026111.1.p2  ORF type:complete len:174 (+),score=48.41 GILI01026111.1:72-524(+)
MLTRLMIPLLKKNASPRACIANLSSGLAQLPGALVAVYSATKAYDDAFSYSLCAELAPYNVDVTTIFPNLVATSMSKVRPGAFIPTAESFGFDVVRQLGAVRVYPNVLHDLQAKLGQLVPDFILCGQVRKMMVATRIKAQKKAAKNEKKQ